MSQSTEFGARDYEDIVNNIDRDGYALLPQFLPPNLLNAVQEEATTIYELSFSPNSKWHLSKSQQSCIYESIPNCPPNARTSNSEYQALRRSWPCLAPVADLLLPPSSSSPPSPVSSLMTHLLGPKATLFNEQYIIKPSRSSSISSFKWHRDSDWCTILQAPTLRYFSLWVALTDTSLDNGCLQMKPGTHIQTQESEDQQEIENNDGNFIVLDMKAGDAVVFTDKVMHCSGPNHSAHVRMAWMPQFSDGPIVDPPTNTPVSFAVPLFPPQ